MRYADTYLKCKRKRQLFPILKNRFKRGQDPDLLMEQFLRAQGEFSAEASIQFDRQLARDRELHMIGAM